MLKNRQISCFLKLHFFYVVYEVHTVINKLITSVRLNDLEELKLVELDYSGLV